MNYLKQPLSKAVALTAKYSVDLSLRQDQLNQTLGDIVEQAKALLTLTSNTGADSDDASILDIAKKQSKLIELLLNALKLYIEFLNVQNSVYTLLTNTTEIKELLTASLSNLDKQLSEFRIISRNSKRQSKLHKKLNQMNHSHIETRKTGE